MYPQSFGAQAFRQERNARENRHTYSISRALKRAIDGREPDGLEGEHHQELVRAYGPTKNTGAFYLPTRYASRDMTAGTAANGGYLVGTDLLAGDFIDLLRNRTIVGQLGARFLSGLRGNVAIPRMAVGATAHWLTNEATAITEADQTLDQLTLTPKNVGAYTEVSRQLLIQSTPNADSVIMNDLAKVLAIAIDKAALEGSGANGQPTGISNTAGIGAVTGTDLAYADILEFQTDLGNALQGLAMGFATTPAVAALLAQRVKVASTWSPIWEGNLLDGRVDGFRAMSTAQLTAASMIFGDWSQLIIGEWGVLELAVNPYANFAAGIHGIRAIQTVDVGIRHASAFSRAHTIT
jgi:HK97 family phage major capsid protein